MDVSYRHGCNGSNMLMQRRQGEQQLSVQFTSWDVGINLNQFILSRKNHWRTLLRLLLKENSFCSFDRNNTKTTTIDVMRRSDWKRVWPLWLVSLPFTLSLSLSLSLILSHSLSFSHSSFSDSLSFSLFLSHRHILLSTLLHTHKHKLSLSLLSIWINSLSLIHSYYLFFTLPIALVSLSNAHSVTRFWNQKQPNFNYTCPKIIHWSFRLKSLLFQNCPKSHQTFGLLFKENL